MIKKIITVIIVLAVVVGIFLVNKSTSDNSVTIGGLFGLTGYVAFAGETSQNGFLMAIEDSDQNIEFTIEDFQSDLAGAVSSAKKLIQIDEVDVVIGPEWVEFSEVVAPLADENEVVFISPWMTGETDWLSSPYFFSATPSEMDQMRALLEHMAQSGFKTIALFGSNNAWSLGLSSIVKDELSRNFKSLTIVQETKNNPDDLDFRTSISKFCKL